MSVRRWASLPLVVVLLLVSAGDCSGAPDGCGTREVGGPAARECSQAGPWSVTLWGSMTGLGVGRISYRVGRDDVVITGNVPEAPMGAWSPAKPFEVPEGSTAVLTLESIAGSTVGRSPSTECKVTVRDVTGKVLKPRVHRVRDPHALKTRCLWPS